MRKYIYAGLDFVFDKNLNAYFLEANSCPGYLIDHFERDDYRKLFGGKEPLEILAEFLSKKDSKKVCLLTRKSTYLKNKVKRKENRVDRLSNFLKNLKISTSIAFLEDNKKNIKRNTSVLKDKKGKLQDFDTLFYSVYTPYRPEKILLINSPVVMEFTRDKWAIYKFLKNSILIPRSFLVKTIKEIEYILRSNRNIFKNAFVIKPNYGEGGKGVQILNEIKKIKNIKPGLKYILQEKIEVEKCKNMFWDVRVFLVNGRVSGAIKRASLNPIVNLSLGGEPLKVEKRLLRILSPIAIKCIELINSKIAKDK